MSLLFRSVPDVYKGESLYMGGRVTAAVIVELYLFCLIFTAPGRLGLIYTWLCFKTDFYHSKCTCVLTETYFERVDKGTKTESKRNCHANEFPTRRVFKSIRLPGFAENRTKMSN